MMDLLSKTLTRLSKKLLEIKEEAQKRAASTSEKSEVLAVSSQEPFVPYGKHVSTISVDVFEKGLYVSVVKGDNTAMAKFVKFQELIDDVQKDQRSLDDK